MNMQGIRHSTIKAHISKAGTTVSAWQQLPQHVIFAGLGGLGGLTGTALAIGLCIIIQASMSSTAIFWPNVILLAAAATLLGWAVAWFLSRTTQRMFNNFFYTGSVEHGMQVALIVSGLASLLQTYLFMYSL